MGQVVLFNTESHAVKFELKWNVSDLEILTEKNVIVNVFVVFDVLLVPVPFNSAVTIDKQP